MTARSTTRVIEPDTASIAEAARVLASGGLVAFPTETVYGLGADATDGTAVARLYEAKGRPAFNPLIAHVPDVKSAQTLVTFDHAAAALAAAFWPGPLTLVLPKAAACPVAELATAGLDTLAVRMPNHPVAHAILEAFGKPIVAPSANRSGHVSPTTAAHVLADLAGRIDLIVDGGADASRRRIHHRRLSRQADAVAAGRSAARCHRASAQKHSYTPPRLPPRTTRRRRYRPACSRPITRRARGCASMPSTPSPAKHSLRLAQYRRQTRLRAKIVLNLSPLGNPVEAAANLFAHLRALDSAGASTIAVMPVPGDGLGEAVNDRLARAAAGR